MGRIFNVGDNVILKDIGVRCMKVISLSDDFDEEAKSHLLGHILKIFDTGNDDKFADNSSLNFDEAQHMIYYATCEWCDDNGIRHEDTFEESKLEYCESLPPRTIIEGFIKKN